MTRNEVAMLTAGLLMGTGAGLVIARSLPPAASNVAAKSSQVEEGSAALQSQSRLFDPEQTPALPTGFGSDSSAHGADREQDLETAVPRLLPEGEATPVERSPEPVTDVDANKEPSETTLSEFRMELEELAPEFNDKQLNELEQIRSVIEADMPESELDLAADERIDGPDADTNP